MNCTARVTAVGLFVSLAVLPVADAQLVNPDMVTIPLSDRQPGGPSEVEFGREIEAGSAPA